MKPLTGLTLVVNWLALTAFLYTFVMKLLPGFTSPMKGSALTAFCTLLSWNRGNTPYTGRQPNNMQNGNIP